ncbi:MAG: hypothetical protein U0736_10170 [Gemmataceae bacterium]
MTEADWLAGSIVFDELLRESPVPISERKLRLFLCACVRQVWPLLIDERCRAAVEAAERFADGLIGTDVLTHAWKGAWEIGFIGAAGFADRAAAMTAVTAVNYLTVSYGTLYARSAMEQEVYKQAAHGKDVYQVTRWTWQVQEALFRDVVGNPFRAAVIDPAWLGWNDHFVRSLADLIDRERRYTDLPVLGDALEDAGCEDEALLAHCHGGRHVRGCWVIDALLGRE